jgi:hypothetical protein
MGFRLGALAPEHACDSGAIVLKMIMRALTSQGRD